MKTALLISTALTFLIFLSCNSKSARENATSSMDVQLADVEKSPFQQRDEEGKQKIPVKHQPQNTADSVAAQVQVKTTSNAEWDKKIIKTATLKLEVKDFKGYTNNIHQTVKKFGGYIAAEEQNATDEKSETIMVIKVPVGQFETMMDQLPGTDNKVVEKRITSEDVTGEVVDTRLRLEAKKGMRLKYLEFLKQSKNMEEILQVQNEINTIQEEMESAAGRIEFLSHQSAYSTINCSFYQPVNGFKAGGNLSFFTRISEAFKTGAAWFENLFIGLIAVWPLLLITTLIYTVWKKFKPSKVIVHNP
jgi:hypothetical protein